MKWYAKLNRFQGLIISEENGDNIAVSYNRDHANLIASAPEMFETLKSVLDVFGEKCGNGCTSECCICAARQIVEPLLVD